MTGYGRGQAVQNGSHITVEISSVNRKQLDINFSLPRELEPLEPRMREFIAQRIARGRVFVRIVLQMADELLARQVHLNRVLAESYADTFRKLVQELRLGGEVTLEHILGAPGVLTLQREDVDPELFWPGLQKAMDRALTQLIRMRTKEGRHLAADLRQRLQRMKKLTNQIRRRAPQVVKNYREQLRRRLETLGMEGLEEDERFTREIVLFAERSDITEELTRLQSHYQQFAERLRQKEPVGRTLDFLAQEMHREINTIGVKANDAEIAHAVVELKAEVERIREQVQNIE